MSVSISLMKLNVWVEEYWFIVLQENLEGNFHSWLPLFLSSDVLTLCRGHKLPANSFMQNVDAEPPNELELTIVLKFYQIS